MATLTNRRTGEQLETLETNYDAAVHFAEEFQDKEHWLWFWIHKAIQERQQSPRLGAALKLIQHMFLLSIGYGLKMPKIRLHYRDRRYVLYLSRRGTLCIKRGLLIPGTHDPVGDQQYIGCIYGGTFLPGSVGYGSNEKYQLAEEEQDFLNRLSTDPTTFMAECSKDMGSCCYCGKQLDDESSKKAGYGPICAKRWGLPWGPKIDFEKAPNFARQYDDNAAGLMDEILDDPSNESSWKIFSDWLEERGLPRAEVPKNGSRIPAKAN